MNLKIKNTESFKGSGEMSPAKEPAGRQLWDWKQPKRQNRFNGLSAKLNKKKYHEKLE